jgi:CHAD domain-containing protein
MGKKTLKANCLFGARYMLTQVEALQDEIEGALVGEDIEHVHQMRVASRRMRNGLALFQDCLAKKRAKAWQDEIRKITKALGNARDLDIQIDLLNRYYAHGLEDRIKPGYNRLILRLKQQRTLAQDKVRRTLGNVQQGGILERMEKQLKALTAVSEHVYLYTPSLYRQAFTAISSNLEAFLSYEGYIHEPENIEELHAMRIAGKHLRYTMEIFAPIYGNTLDPHIHAMKDVQDLLGEIHDNDVWIDWLPKFIAKEQARIEDYFGNKGPLKRLLPGFNHFMEDRQRVRDQEYRTFLSIWENLQYENAWSVLTEVIKAPINIEAALAHLSPNSEDLADASKTAGDESGMVELTKPDILDSPKLTDVIDPTDESNHGT